MSTDHDSSTSTATSSSSNTPTGLRITSIVDIVAEGGRAWVDVVCQSGEGLVVRRVTESELVGYSELCREWAAERNTQWSVRMSRVIALADQQKAEMEAAVAAELSSEPAPADANEGGRKRRRSSAIWDAFTLQTTIVTETVEGVQREKKKATTKCKVVDETGSECGRIHAYSGTTSNMWKHLSACHRILHEKLNPRKGRDVPPLPEAARAQAEEQLALWIVRNARPLHELRDVEFINYSVIISSGAYTVPSPYHIKKRIGEMMEDCKGAILLLLKNALQTAVRIPVALDEAWRINTSCHGLRGCHRGCDVQMR
eukprot:GHVU01057543.1.p1 GENE.GHVU01057543.1~~GHVU01057543.1.p1  ORF type:complete len:314 (-),score=27.44 GHVU01057543.1:28-969(-)